MLVFCFYHDVPSIGFSHYMIFIGFADFLESGGIGGDQGEAGDNGTITGKACPKGLYGTFCKVHLPSSSVYIVSTIVLSSDILCCSYFCMKYL